MLHFRSNSTKLNQLRLPEGIQRYLECSVGNVEEKEVWLHILNSTYSSFPCSNFCYSCINSNIPLISCFFFCNLTYSLCIRHTFILENAPKNYSKVYRLAELGKKIFYFYLETITCVHRVICYTFHSNYPGTCLLIFILNLLSAVQHFVLHSSLLLLPN